MISPYDRERLGRVAAWCRLIVTLGIFLIGFLYYHRLIRPHSTERWTLPAPADEEIG